MSLDRCITIILVFISTLILAFACTGTEVTQPDGDNSDTMNDGDFDLDLVTDGDEVDDVDKPDVEKDRVEIDGDLETLCQYRCINVQCLSCTHPPDGTVMDFGAVSPPSCETITLQITSVGSMPIQIFSVGLVTSETSPEYTITGYEESAPPVTLDPMRILKVDVTYCPIDAEEDSGKLFIATDSDFEQRKDIKLTMGYKGSTLLKVEPLSLDWDEVMADGVSGGAKAIVITADPVQTDATRPLEVLAMDMGLSEGAFTLSTTGGCEPPFFLVPNATKQCLISFKTSAVGEFSDKLTIKASDYATTPLEQVKEIDLSATGGKSTIDLSREDVDFNYVLVGRKATEMITVTNTGTIDLVIEAENWSSNPSGYFSIDDTDDVFNPTLTISSGQSKTFWLEYEPLVTGTNTATLRIISNDIDRSFVEVLITGLGVDECPQGYAPDPSDTARCIPSCTPGELVCNYATYEVEEISRTGWGYSECQDDGETLGEFIPCPLETQVCVDGVCKDPPCIPGEFQCLDLNHHRECNASRFWNDPVECSTIGGGGINSCRPWECRTRQCGEFFATPGTDCDDGNPCIENTKCNALGVCAGDEVDCDDENVCTTDLCDDSGAGCVYVANNAEECDDGNPCTKGDHCMDKVCVAGDDEDDCDDNEPCTDDFCSLEDGCYYENNSDPCSDNDVCFLDDFCSEGSCVSGSTELDCEDNNDCTRDFCQSPGGCQHPFQAGYCDDGDPCTVDDYCVQGSPPYCKSGDRIICNDHEDCTSDSCDEAGACIFTDLVDGTTCSDNLLCTGLGDEATPDQCVGGECIPGSQADCEDENVCTTNYCSESVGCTNIPNAFDCDDNNPCTIGDYCSNRTCQPGSGELDCDDHEFCTINSCDPSVPGGCVTSNKPDGTSCNADNNTCTVNDSCQAGVCIPGEGELLCNDNNPCTIDSCEAGGGCTFTADDTLECDDGDPCTVGDHCTLAKTCIGGDDEFDCDDEDPCTRDSCVANVGCSHVDLSTGSCDDGDPCSIGDYCSGGLCQSGAEELSCNDGEDCTDDTCIAGVGCDSTNDNTNSCSDGNECTLGDHCDAGNCIEGATANDCADDNDCTDNYCVDFVGCKYNLRNGESCSDDNLCTVGDVCSGLDCISGPVDDCDDENDCTADTCLPLFGCQNDNDDTLFCNDQSQCTTGDHCDDGSCVGSVRNCDDTNVCTDEYCDDAIGCVSSDNTAPCDPLDVDSNICTDDVCSGGSCTHPNNNAPCSDGNFCNGEDLCFDGSCAAHNGNPCTGGTDCNYICNEDEDNCFNLDGTTCALDSEVCTDDVCDGAGTCTHPNNTASCDDGEFCTANDTCLNGACTESNPRSCNDQCETGVCDEVGNECTPVADGTDCNDGEPSTFDDSCQNGVCIGSNAFLSPGVCPTDSSMVKIVGTRVCIDKYEAIVCKDNCSSHDDCKGQGNDDDYWSCFWDDGSRHIGCYSSKPKACSLQGQTPSRFITYDQAKSACEVSGKRLCSEQEIVKSCSLNGAYTYPWGSTWDDTTKLYCNGADYGDANGGQQIRTTGSLANCTNNWLAFDLTGNASEWLSDQGSSASRRKYRDGNYSNSQSVMACSVSGDREWDDDTAWLGFRCCETMDDK